MNREPLRSASDIELYELAETVGQALLAAGGRIATAESCTAGWIAKVLTDVPGSSRWVECGFITYSNLAKTRDLGVPQAVLEAHGAVSAETVRAMAQGALERTGVPLAVAVSGIAGPDGGSPDKPVGTVWFGVAHLQQEGAAPHIRAQLKLFAGDREQVRRQSVEHALQLVLAALREGP